jgi:N-acetylmuramoyl-L-alanine amidase
MDFGKKLLHRIFAPVSLGFILAMAVASPRAFGADTSRAVKKQAASAQFDRAEELRTALNSKPTEKRTLNEYKQAVTSYRRVALITPKAPEVADSLVAVGELYTEMGERFGRSYFQSSVDSYQFLLREYPTSHYCQDVMLRIAKLQRDQLGDPSLAKKTYEDFLKKYPRSAKKREVQESLAELALLQNSESAQSATVATKKTAATEAAEKPAEAAEQPDTSLRTGGSAPSHLDGSGIPRVRRIRAAADGDTTRVTIDLEDSVQYSSGRIANPERIFFDLHAARLSAEAARGNVKVEGGLLTGVRVAQNHAGVVRVVLDVNGVKDYASSLTNNPTQLVIDLFGSTAKQPVQTAKVSKTPKPLGATNEDNSTAGPEQKSDQTEAAATIAKKTSVPSPRNSLPTLKNTNSKTAKGAGNGKPDLVQPATSPQPTRDGQSTLTRALGLKIGRIVIDAGHGGHDTGTIGPTGLMEKDLCLDVALRLGKIIEQKLPGADVIFTRADDTFVPLEERTHIANQAKADLFLSIHANSSSDHGARGIETYYLNLKGSAEAMEVAARENATAQEGVHELQDLVKKIAQTEKIDESRELAADVQDSLARRIQKVSKAEKNRGVRKAPFVVLIGADMPSILTEISFLSNAADEQLLKKPEQRQKVAEGLYQGVASYLQSINSVTVNMPGKAGTKPNGPARTVEQSRNQN